MTFQPGAFQYPGYQITADTPAFQPGAFQYPGYQITADTPAFQPGAFQYPGYQTHPTSDIPIPPTPHTRPTGGGTVVYDGWLSLLASMKHEHHKDDTEILLAMMLFTLAYDDTGYDC